MKYFVFLLLLICNTAAYPQLESDTKTMLTFELDYPPMGDNDIDWSREKPKCEFILNGKTPLKYSMALENDTIASLARYENKQWVLQEDMQYQSYFLYREENELFTHFRIADFDKDGDEDLLCWIFSNINGNEWTIVFLNDQKNKKLIRLIDTAEKTDIWNRPEYDEKNKFINCTLDGSAFGVSEESTYMLDNLTAIPLEKHYQDRTNTVIRDYEYIGENGKWKLIKSENNIEFIFPESSNDSIDWQKDNISSEFMLIGEKNLICSIKILNGDEAVLMEYKNEKWETITTLKWFKWPSSEGSVTTESFIITDFDNDGNEDLMNWTHTNINGNRWIVIYIYDPLKEALVLLKNADDDVWTAPQYNADTKIITSTTVSGIFGVSEVATYRLENQKAIPLFKEVTDNTNFNIQTGKGGVYKKYIGENGKWKLVKKKKLRQ